MIKLGQCNWAMQKCQEIVAVSVGKMIHAETPMDLVIQLNRAIRGVEFIAAFKGMAKMVANGSPIDAKESAHFDEMVKDLEAHEAKQSAFANN